MFLRDSLFGAVLLWLILFPGCMPREQPKLVPQARSRVAPRLMGVNHLFTIAGYFSQPAGIAVDAEGNLFVADSGKSVIHVLDSDGRLLESIGRFGWRSGEFDTPTDVALDGRLRLYIADSGNNRVQRFGLISRSFRTVAGEKHDNLAETQGAATVFPLHEPQSVAANMSGYLYIADTWNHRVLKLDPQGRLQMEIGGMGQTGQQFRNPQGVMADSKNDIYISDTGNHRVHKLDFSGTQLAVWGEEGTGAGQFLNPVGQAVDRFGNVYVADQGNHRVQIFGPEGRYLAEFGQQVLNSPVDVAVGSSLRAYVTDVATGNVEVFRIIYEIAEDKR